MLSNGYSVTQYHVILTLGKRGHVTVIKRVDTPQEIKVTCTAIFLFVICKK
jgi:hypothetical protein